MTSGMETYMPTTPNLSPSYRRNNQDRKTTQQPQGGQGNAPSKEQQWKTGHGINAQTAVKEHARAHKAAKTRNQKQESRSTPVQLHTTCNREEKNRTTQ